MAKLLQGSTINNTLIWYDGGTTDREATLVYQSQSQSITTGAFTQVTFDTVRYDNLTTWVSSNNSFTIKKGGMYYISASINWQNVVSGTRSVLEVRKNGASWIWLGESVSGAGKSFIVNGSATCQFSTNDVITLFAYQDTSGAMGTSQVLDSNNAPIPTTFFNIIKIA